MFIIQSVKSVRKHFKFSFYGRGRILHFCFPMPVPPFLLSNFLFTYNRWLLSHFTVVNQPAFISEGREGGPFSGRTTTISECDPEVGGGASRWECGRLGRGVALKFTTLQLVSLPSNSLILIASPFKPQLPMPGLLLINVPHALGTMLIYYLYIICVNFRNESLNS